MNIYNVKLQTIFTYVIILFVIFTISYFSVFTVYLHMNNYTMNIPIGNSMEPVITDNEFIISYQYDYYKQQNNITTGDKIVFNTECYTNDILHSVIDKPIINNETVYITYGLNNNETLDQSVKFENNKVTQNLNRYYEYKISDKEILSLQTCKITDDNITGVYKKSIDSSNINWYILQLYTTPYKKFFETFIY